MTRTPIRPRVRRWSDVLHRWLGFTAGAILVVIGLSGSLLAFYVEIERSFYPHMRTIDARALPSSYEAVYQRLEQLSLDPPGGAWGIEIPPTQTYDLQIRQAGAPMNRFPRTHLCIDQYSGRVLDVHDPKVDGFGDMVLNWLVPLHDGKAFGLVGRVMVMLLGLTPSVMFVTGFMRWNHKRAARTPRAGSGVGCSHRRRGAAPLR